MRATVTVLVAVFAVAGCATAGSDGAAGRPTAGHTTAGPPVQAAAAALAFAAHDDPDVAVVDGYATLPLTVQRGEEPIDLVRGHATPCLQRPARPFTAGERAAIRAAFQGRTVHFVGDPAAADAKGQPGRLLLAVSPPILHDQRGTVMVVRCVPQAQQHLVAVSWDGYAWQALATG